MIFFFKVREETGNFAMVKQILILVKIIKLVRTWESFFLVATRFREDCLGHWFTDVDTLDHVQSLNSSAKVNVSFSRWKIKIKTLLACKRG